MRMYPNLKLQIFRSGNRQNELAKALGIDQTVLSKIIHGCRNPTVSQKKLLAAYLEAEEAWLFERFEVPPGRAGQQQIGITPGKEAGGDERD